MVRGGSAFKRVFRRYHPASRQRAATLRRFARKIGLVYFGNVDQHDSEHQQIRGLTVSTTHRDSHYAVGSYDGYDVSLVDRLDITGRGKTATEYRWVILQVDLRHDTIPHVFLKPRGTAENSYHPHAFASRHLIEISGLFAHSHRQDFLRRFETYAKSTNAQPIEDLLTPDVTQILAARFWPHAVEVWDGKLYVYMTEHRLSETVLTAALEAALWLASVLDKRED